RVAVGREAERASDVDRAYRLLGHEVVDDGMAGADEDLGARGGDGSALPGAGLGPGPALRGLDQVGRRPGREQDEAGRDDGKALRHKLLQVALFSNTRRSPARVYFLLCLRCQSSLNRLNVSPCIGCSLMKSSFSVTPSPGPPGSGK